MKAPTGWVELERRDDGFSCKHFQKPIFAICSLSVEEDGKDWLHVSVSKQDHKGRMIDVSWEEICQIKEDFIGDKYAYMVFPPKENYVNIAHVFHLWCRIGEDKVLPEFSMILPGVGRSI